MPSDQPPAEAETKTEIAKVAPPPLQAGAKLAAIIPRSLEEAWRIAQYFEASDLGPKDMKTAKKLIVPILAGIELGMPPVQAIQSFANINGRPTLWGDGLLAVVLANGVKVEEWMDGTGDERVAYCKVTRTDRADKQVIERYFSVEDAKEAKLWGKEGPWQTYRRRMLQMRARAWAIRDGCADLLRGIQMAEEVLDYGATVINPDAPPLPSVADALKDETGGEDNATIEVVDATYEEAPATGDQAPKSPNSESELSPPADAGADSERIESGLNPPPQNPDENPEGSGVDAPKEVEVRPQASGFTPAQYWVDQVREAFQATKTKPEFRALEARWKSRANTETLAQIRVEAPAIAAELEREYEALEQAIRGGK